MPPLVIVKGAPSKILSLPLLEMNQMWRSVDGMANTAALPSHVEELAGLRAYLSTLSPEERDLLDDEMQEFIGALFRELRLVPIDEGVEAQFVGVALPPEFASNLDWTRLLGADHSIELGRIDLRWRLDVAEAVADMVADLDEELGLV